MATDETYVFEREKTLSCPKPISTTKPTAAEFLYAAIAASVGLKPNVWRGEMIVSIRVKRLSTRGRGKTRAGARRQPRVK